MNPAARYWLAGAVEIAANAAEHVSAGLQAVADWLDPDLTDPRHVADLLRGGPPGRFTAYPVSRAVSSNRSNGPELLDPLPESELRGVVDPMTGEIVGGTS